MKSKCHVIYISGIILQLLHIFNYSFQSFLMKTKKSKTNNVNENQRIKGKKN